MFVIKKLKIQGRTRYHVECLNRKFMPEKPDNSHFAFCNSFLEVKSFIEMLSEHVEEAVEMQAHEEASVDYEKPDNTE